MTGIQAQSFNWSASRETIKRHFFDMNVVRLHRLPPFFGGGGFSSVAASVVLTAHTMHMSIAVWSGIELMLGTGWLLLIWRERQYPSLPTASHSPMFAQLDLLGACSIGFGAVCCILSSDVLAITVGAVSAAAFAGEACALNVRRPRLLAAMLAVGTAPAVLASLTVDHPAVSLARIMAIFYVGCMLTSSMAINRLFVATLRAERENDHRARHDRLTGLLNRAGLERELDIIRSERPTALLSFYFVDLDHFKQVNDCYGHGVGDQVLRLVAEGLLELCGPDDVVARFGGDEFIIVTDLDLVRVEEFGTALLSTVGRVNASLDLGATLLSASVGAAQTRAKDIDLGSVLKTADLALYRSKSRGGNSYSIGDVPKVD